jgi:hypothetical protein
MKEEMKPLTVRIPASLLAQMKEYAQRNNRSLNGEIVTALEEHMKKEQQKRK